jgi:sugar phosphate isomerase/epimerase
MGREHRLLGGKTLRIFAGTVEKTDTEEKARERVVAAIQEACDHAATFGVYLALENHGGITSTPEQILALVKAVKHDWFGVNLDTGNFHTEDPYADLARIAPYAVNVQVKTEIQAAGKKKEEADLKKLIGMLRDAGYRGYVALEYEAAEDPKTAVPRHAAERKLMGCRSTQLPTPSAAGRVVRGYRPLRAGQRQMRCSGKRFVQRGRERERSRDTRDRAASVDRQA